MKKSAQKAFDFYNKKQYTDALKIISTFDKKTLLNENIMLLAGNCYDALGEKSTAVKYYKKAHKINPDSENPFLNMAICYLELNKYSKSKKYAEKALSLNSKSYQALCVLGNIYNQKKHYSKAIKFYQESILIKKDFYQSNMNLANIFYKQKNNKKAYFYASRAMKIDARQKNDVKIFAEICIELQKAEKALPYLLKVSKILPEDYLIHDLLSRIYMQQKKYNNALKESWCALNLSSGENSQHINFGYTLYEILSEENTKISKKYAKDWLEKYPENPIVQHMASAILSNKKISQSNIKYVSEIFDAFAEDFEYILKHLNYNVPNILAKELDYVFKVIKPQKMKILDAGCGTGLCAFYLKKYSKYRGLDGVDISSKMLEVAKKKKAYTHLYNQELCYFLKHHKNKYDLINAADVFTYFGNLEELLNFCCKSIKKNGRILFSITENNIDDSDYFLHSSGRFLHSRNYVENILKGLEFFTERINHAHLRDEGNKKVCGWIFMAVKTK